MTCSFNNLRNKSILKMDIAWNHTNSASLASYLHLVFFPTGTIHQTTSSYICVPYSSMHQSCEYTVLLISALIYPLITKGIPVSNVVPSLIPTPTTLFKNSVLPSLSLRSFSCTVSMLSLLISLMNQFHDAIFQYLT